MKLLAVISVGCDVTDQLQADFLRSGGTGDKIGVQ
jgi:hypothetical protein